MLTFFVTVPILIAVFLYLFPFKTMGRITAIVLQTGLFAATVYLFIITRTEEIVSEIGGYGSLGITLRADALSAAFILLTAFIFLMAAIYSYKNDKSKLFWFLFFIWQASLIGIFLSGDLFNIFVLMEVGTVVVSVLIMYNRKERSMYDGMIYLMINVVIMQFYLLGLGYVYSLVGVLDIGKVADALAGLEAGQQILPYALIITFVALKCALVPVFSWLPKAHGTPGASGAVSAVLSGLHIKSALYLFIRFQDVFEVVAATELFVIIGIITAIFGVVMSFSQTNIKLILAYSTVAQVGLIVTGLSLGSYYSTVGGMYHMVTHAVFKTALFMGAGAIIRTYGTKDITQIRGVWMKSPLIARAMVLAILGIIGVPFFSGSVSKYFLSHGANGFLTVVMAVINLGTILIFFKFATIFGGELSEKTHTERTDYWQVTPLWILGVLSLLLGIFGQRIIGVLFGVDVSVDLLGYVQKSAIFVASFLVGYVLFKYYYKDYVWLKKARAFELGFRTMCAMIGVFFAVVVVWLLVKGAM